jgi:hypothetical protein
MSSSVSKKKLGGILKSSEPGYGCFCARHLITAAARCPPATRLVSPDAIEAVG